MLLTDIFQNPRFLCWIDKLAYLKITDLNIQSQAYNNSFMISNSMFVWTVGTAHLTIYMHCMSSELLGLKVNLIIEFLPSLCSKFSEYKNSESPSQTS